MWQCSFCEGSLFSDEERKEHELSCRKNPKNGNISSAHFKERMKLNKKRKD